MQERGRIWRARTRSPNPIAYSASSVVFINGTAGFHFFRKARTNSGSRGKIAEYFSHAR